jgi:thiosulfate dehydrogenase [quinone] large subunit
MKKFNITSGQKTALVVLRVLIGWHFLYEGIIKMYNPSWTAKGYLLSAEFFRPFFVWLAGESMISIVDTMNIVGLVAVGVSLMLGLRIKWGCIGGIALLAMYYLAHPPFGAIQQGPAEGSYWIVNKNLIEIAALYVLYIFPTAAAFSLEKLFPWKRKAAIQPSTTEL